MKKFLSHSLVLAACVIFVPGCATIVHGTTQKVKVTSVPPGATIMVHGQEQATPAELSLKGSSDGYDIVANKPGYKTAYAHIDSSFRAGTTIFGNICWLLPGLLVDFLTGSAFELQDQINIPMEKK